jgi:glycosyltransferase involved in cell wall biosynthesis
MINSSGIGTYIKALLPGICQNFKTNLLTDEPELLENYTGNFQVARLPAPFYSIAEQIKYLSIPATDILFTPHYNIPLLPVRSKKRVVTIHDVYHLAHYRQLTRSQKLYAKILINMAVRLSDAVITVSEFSKKEIIKYTGCKGEKITVIHNGVKQLAASKSENEIRLRYNLPEKYILFVGNVKPHKNLRILLEAYKLLEADIRAEYKIVIAGKKDGFITNDTNLFQLIDATPELTNNITFTGFVNVDDMDTLYSGASLFVFPSLYEGFGLPPLEAMLNNCPVIVSNAASLPEICGDAVLYFNPYHPKDLADKILCLLKDADLRQSLIKKGKQHIKKYTWEMSLEKHMEVFRSLHN